MRLNANPNRFNVNCNRNPQNSKFCLVEQKEQNESSAFGNSPSRLKMKTYRNLFLSIVSIENLKLAHKRVRKGKTKKIIWLNLRKIYNLIFLFWISENLPWEADISALLKAQVHFNLKNAKRKKLQILW